MGTCQIITKNFFTINLFWNLSIYNYKLKSLGELKLEIMKDSKALIKQYSERIRKEVQEQLLLG